VKRLFWLGVGVVAGVALTRKAGETARQVTPSGLASNLGDAVRELAGAVGSFGAEVRAGMSERERELHDMVEERTGLIAPPCRRALRPASSPGGGLILSRPARPAALSAVAAFPVSRSGPAPSGARPQPKDVPRGHTRDH
jgi:hypothetical protein